MSRSELRGLVLRVLVRLVEAAGNAAADYIEQWADPCERLVLAHLRLDRAREDKSRVRVAFWSWRTRVLGQRCAELQDARGVGRALPGCTALDVAQECLSIARRRGGLT